MSSNEQQPAQQTIVMNSSFIGRVEEFIPGSYWKHYVEKVEMFFEVNSVAEDKKVPTILTLMGNKMYALLRNIVSPGRPRELSFVDIVDNLAKHLDPKPIVIAERFKFHKAEQQESESIRDFLARLKKLAETCEFGGYREEAIRDRFVCGLKERTIQRNLLAVADLTLQSAVEKACAAELTEKETIALHEGGVEEANKVRVTFPECFRCGKVNHSSDTCFFRNSKCHGCQKVGHIVKKCPVKVQNPESGKAMWKPKARSGKKKKKQQKVCFVEEDLTVKQSANGSDWPMFIVSDSRGKCKEFIVPVTIDGKTVGMELDTGASVTIIPESVWTDVPASKPVERTDIKLRSYSGHEISVIGEAKVQVAYRDQKAVLSVVITGSDGPVLIGRDWLSVLKLDWGQVKRISLEPVDKLDQLRTKYSSLFDIW